MVARDLTGMTFGRLTVLRRVENGKNGAPRWLCKCNCSNGNTIVTEGFHLTSGHTQSCGCIQKERAREAKTKWRTKEEHDAADIFRDMKKRCYNPNNKEFHRYGGRGIRICDEWLQDRSKFVDWAVSHGYRKGLEIDRINNDGSYGPDNCRFIDHAGNSNNKSTNRRIVIDGVEHTLSEWSEIAELNYDNLQYLLTANPTRCIDTIVNSEAYQRLYDQQRS